MPDGPACWAKGPGRVSCWYPNRSSPSCWSSSPRSATTSAVSAAAGQRAPPGGHPARRLRAGDPRTRGRVGRHRRGRRRSTSSAQMATHLRNRPGPRRRRRPRRPTAAWPREHRLHGRPHPSLARRPTGNGRSRLGRRRARRRSMTRAGACRSVHAPEVARDGRAVPTAPQPTTPSVDRVPPRLSAASTAHHHTAVIAHRTDALDNRPCSYPLTMPCSTHSPCCLPPLARAYANSPTCSPAVRRHLDSEGPGCQREPAERARHQKAPSPKRRGLPAETLQRSDPLCSSGSAALLKMAGDGCREVVHD